MPEPELVPGSEGRARSDRDLAVGLQRGAAPQLAGVSDPGGVRSPSSSAPVAYGSLRAAARPGPGNFASARKPPGSYIMLGLQTGGRSRCPSHAETIPKKEMVQSGDAGPIATSARAEPACCDRRPQAEKPVRDDCRVSPRGR